MAAMWIDDDEIKVSGFLWELLCLNYGKETDSKYYIERARVLQRKLSAFSKQNDPLKKICIYQSETPCLFVNMESNEVGDDDWGSIISFGGGVYEESFYEGSADNLYSDLASATEEEQIDYLFCGARAIAESENGDANKESTFATFCQKIGVGTFSRSSVSEAIFYYRQSQILQKRIVGSGLFNCDDEFFVTCATHDCFEELNTELWSFVSETIDTRISEVYARTGLL